MRRLILVLLGFVLCCGLTPGCSFSSNASNEATLVEKRIQLDEESRIILSLDNVDNRTVVLCSDTAQQKLLYGELSTNSNGSDEITSVKEILSLSDDQHITAVDISPTGDIVYGTITENGATTRCYIVDKTGEQKEISIEIENVANISETIEVSSPVNAIAHLEATDAGFILLQDYYGNLVKVDPNSGKILAEFKTTTNSQIIDYVVKENNLITIVASFLEGGVSYSVSNYSLENGDISNSYDELEKTISSLLPAEAKSIDQINSPIIVDANNELYLYSNGALHIINENNETSMLTPGNNTLLANTSMTPVTLLPNKDGFCILYIEHRNQLSPFSLYSYSFEHKQSQSRSLTVYMLEDNREIRQAIASFKEENAETEIITQVGLPFGTDLSTEDAIKQLNLEMMAGNGPDVIVLDGISVQHLQDQDLLVDINDIYEKLKNSDSEYFDSVISGYKNADGTCYAIPTRFIVPSALINEERFSDIETLSDFTELVKSYQDKQVSLLGVDIDIATLYAANYENLVSDINAISKEELTAFFKQCSEMVEVSQKFLKDNKNIVDEGFDVIDESLAGFEKAQNATMGVSYILGDKRILGEIGTINSPIRFSEVALTENCSEPRLKFGLLRFGKKQIFIPQASLAVVSSSKNIDAAQSFIEFTLSYDQQLSDQRVGLPVCKDAFASLIHQGIEINKGPEMIVFDGGKTFSYGPLTDEEINSYVEMLDTAEVVYDDDKGITNIIKNELESYLRGQKTLAEASESAYQKISLYSLE